MSKRRIHEIPLETRVEQGKASNPHATVWVSANAGSGKTHVLSERVIRLLLSGVEPSAIVCLTYTKAAAALMANRVFERLSQWTILDDADLAAEIESLDGTPPPKEKLTAARRLFARALETPGGLKIQTIHAFCQMILARFPLEANIAGRFELMDDELGAHFHAEARRLILQSVQDGAAPELRAALYEIISRNGEHAFESLMESARKHRQRDELAAFASGFGGDGLSETRLHDFLGVKIGDAAANIIATSWPLKSSPEALLRKMAQAALASNLSTQQNFGEALGAVLAAADPADRFHKLNDLVFTKAGKPKSTAQLAKNSLLAAFPDIETILANLADELLQVDDSLRRLELAKLARHGFMLVGALLEQYKRLKSTRTLLDHDDVINRTVKLLSQPGAGAWVQYKLDQGIDHILVDEAQDTSPPQWKVIGSLAEEFFAGDTARKVTRTLFAVGDEKQSIYSFQGARPEVFSQTGRSISRRAGEANLAFDRARLNLSFRSTGDILSAVDKVFEDPSNRNGLTFDGDYVGHQPIRIHGPGRVEVWPLVKADKSGDVPQDWTKGSAFESKPAVRLAKAVAAVIADWVLNKHMNEATGKLIQPRDIMVLVRKRGPFVHALSRELKSLHVPVSGVDRLKLSDHIAVLDLLAIARICLQPEDDLSLASVLRSPVFGLSDDELTELAARRGTGVSLLASLTHAAKTNTRLATIVAELDRWRIESGVLSVFDFFACLLSRDKVRARLMHRLGNEAGDVIDEFLNFALASEKAGLSGLQAFVETLASAAPEIKRELDPAHDEVRIMTVHGAKGQEAPIVFLVDPPPSPLRQSTLFSVSETPPVFVWEPSVSLSNSKTLPFHGEQKHKQAQEFRRLLYVAMTRAEDRLIVCGFANKHELLNADTWLDMVGSALSAEGASVRFEPHPHLDGDKLIWQTTSGKAPDPQDQPANSVPVPPMPSLLAGPMPPVKLVPRPLSPSRTSLIIEPQPESAMNSPVLSPDADRSPHAVQRGLVMHKLLEVLPGLDRADRAGAADRYLAHKAGEWSEGERSTVKRQALAVLDDPAFAPVFAPGSRAEVSIMGTLRLGGGDRVITGKIDRIAVQDGRVFLIDYKTDHAVPAGHFEIPGGYLAQMALYRALLAPLYPGKSIEAALLYTASARLHSLPPAMLDAALEALTDS